MGRSYMVKKIDDLRGKIEKMRAKAMVEKALYEADDLCKYIIEIIQEAHTRLVCDAINDRMPELLKGKMRQMAGIHADNVLCDIVDNKDTMTLLVMPHNLFTALLCKGMILPDEYVYKDTWTDEIGVTYSFRDSAFTICPPKPVEYIECVYSITKDGVCSSNPQK